MTSLVMQWFLLTRLLTIEWSIQSLPKGGSLIDIITKKLRVRAALLKLLLINSAIMVCLLTHHGGSLVELVISNSIIT